MKVTVRVRGYVEWPGLGLGFGLGFSVGLWLELGSGVSVRVRIMFRTWVMVRCGRR